MNTLPFDIRNVTDILGFRPIPGKDHGSSYGIVCPYCGDERGKMNICVTKDGSDANVYRCIICGNSGNMIKLYCDFSGKNFNDEDQRKESVKEIIQKLGISDNTVVKPQKTEKKREKRDADYINNISREFLRRCTLQNRHKADLLRRGLNETQIRGGGFKSVPSNKMAHKIIKSMISEGYNFDGVPGFFLDDYNNWSMSTVSGYFCPAFDAKKRVTGLCIKADKVVDGRKYVWLSSRDKKQGTKQDAVATFLGNPNSERVIITEGILKAYVYYCLTGNTVIGMSGIGNRSSLKDMLRTLPNLKYAVEAFDMDKLLYPVCKHDYKCQKCKGLSEKGFCVNKLNKVLNIQSDQKKLLELLKEKYFVTTWFWDYEQINGARVWSENFKGIDDFELSKIRKE